MKMIRVCACVACAQGPVAPAAPAPTVGGEVGYVSLTAFYTPSVFWNVRLGFCRESEVVLPTARIGPKAQRARQPNRERRESKSHSSTFPWLDEPAGLS